MNFDRNRQANTARTQNFGFDLIGRIQSLPTVKRIYLYVILMTLVGAATGAVKYRVEAASCTAENSCWIEPEQRKIKELGVGAAGGAIAATLISLPALREDN